MLLAASAAVSKDIGLLATFLGIGLIVNVIVVFISPCSCAASASRTANAADEPLTRARTRAGQAAERATTPAWLASDDAQMTYTGVPTGVRE